MLKKKIQKISSRGLELGLARQLIKECDNISRCIKMSILLLKCSNNHDKEVIIKENKIKCIGDTSVCFFLPATSFILLSP